MREVRNPQKELESGVRIFSIFNEELPALVSSDSDLEALGNAMAELTPPGNSAMSGYTYLGQFLAHDLSRIRCGQHGPNVTPLESDKLSRFVTPAFDLDSVYANLDNDREKKVDNHGHMILGQVSGDSDSSSCAYVDLPRDSVGGALIGDERNDENLIVAQLHVQFLKLHNFFIDEIRADHPQLSPEECFVQARDQVVLHYQEVVLFDLLEKILEASVWRALVVEDEDIIWSPLPTDEPAIPQEYAVAAGRFGHSMIRHSYVINRVTSVKSTDALFTMTGVGGFDSQIKRLPQSHVVDWIEFFDFSSEVMNRPFFQNFAHRISPAVNVNLSIVDPTNRSESQNLATRNLLRGCKLGLCSGQTAVDYVKRKFGIKLQEKGIELRSLTKAELNINDSTATRNVLCNINAGLVEATPLWYYLLAEARAARHPTLGVLGSLIFGETIKGLLKYSRISAERRNDIEPTKVVIDRSGARVKRLQMTDLLLAVNPGLPDPLPTDL